MPSGMRPAAREGGAGTGKGSRMIRESTIQSMIDDLHAGRSPAVDPESIPCFSAEALEGSPVLRKEQLAEVLGNLTEADVCTLERALESLENNEQAWLGFKIVTDEGKALTPVDPFAPTDSKEGPSADGLSTIFYATESKEIVCSRPWNKRDRFQMLDVTRGPSMHKDQFPGLTWASVPLFTTQRVVIYGAGDVSVYLARYADDCGFTSVVIDDDPAFLTEQRFPLSERMLVDRDWADLGEKLSLDVDDYCVCVSRSHLHDVDTLAYSVASEAFYIGMMGNPGKNQDVYDKIVAQGVSPEALERVHAPIGVQIADKTPAEIAISIIAELVDVRGKARLEAVERANARKSA